MAINDQELEQKLKDLDRAIELGETEEDMESIEDLNLEEPLDEEP